MSQIPLVVIDVQPDFFEYLSPFQSRKIFRGVSTEINKAVRRQAPILLVEFTGCDLTCPEITSLITKYPHKHIVKKSTNDGSLHILEKLLAIDCVYSVLRICGLFTNACIQETMKGLANLRPHLMLELVRGASSNCKADRRSYQSTYAHMRYYVPQIRFLP